MAQPYIGQILLFAGSFVPAGYLACDGSVIAISGNEVLYTLIGTTYGGDGQSTFGLPDLRSRVAVGMGSAYGLGQSGGAEQVTLTADQIGPHNHAVSTAGSTSTTNTPSGTTILADQIGGSVDGNLINAYGAYSATDQTNLASGTIGLSPVSGPAPHENRQPLLAVTIAIATVGAFPPHS